jgi:transposase
LPACRAATIIPAPHPQLLTLIVAQLASRLSRYSGRRGDLIKLLWWDGQGLVLYSKRLERGRFVWPQASSGVVTLTAAQLSMLLEGIDWRMPAWTARPQAAV